MQVTVIRRKRRDTKGETVFDIPAVAPRPREGGGARLRTYSTRVCSVKWLLCSSDNATAPAEARGHEGERIARLVEALRHLKR